MIRETVRNSGFTGQSKDLYCFADTLPLCDALLAAGAQCFAIISQINRAEDVAGAIAHGLSIGGGGGPTHHFFDLYARAGLAAD